MDEQKQSARRSGGYLRELWLNQIWQGANFLSKAVFLTALTPLMLQRWGRDGYGLFALCSSLLVSMALLDGGVRALTRLRLAEAEAGGDRNAAEQAYTNGLFSFSVLVLMATALASALAFSGGLGAALHLPPGGSLVLVVMVALTGLLMISLLALEPIAARGKLSLVKAANTAGALAAIPVCASAVWFGAGVLLTSILYSACLIVPNLALIVREKLLSMIVVSNRMAPLRVIRSTLASGLWYYLTTVSLILKTHLLTFVVSAIAGPAEAGMFYIALRITELIGGVGATASDTSLASLASAATREERSLRFAQSWVYVALFCGHGALVLAFQGHTLLQLWLPKLEVGGWTGAGMAFFGLSGAFSRVIVNASMGLGKVRLGAQANLQEALIDLVCAGFGYHLAGISGLLFGGGLGIVAMAPAARTLAQLCGQTVWATYFTSLRSFSGGFLVSSLIQAAAALSPAPWVKLSAIACTAAVMLLELRRIHRA